MNNLLSFEDYVEDFLDMHICLMSEKELAEAGASYEAWMKPIKKEVKEKHRDAGLKLPQLLAKAKRLIEDQQYSINKNSAQYDVSLSVGVVEKGKALLSGKAKKAQLLDLITQNSDASRALNLQINF